MGDIMAHLLLLQDLFACVLSFSADDVGTILIYRDTDANWLTQYHAASKWRRHNLNQRTQIPERLDS